MLSNPVFGNNELDFETFPKSSSTLNVLSFLVSFPTKPPRISLIDFLETFFSASFNASNALSTSSWVAVAEANSSCAFWTASR